MIPSKAHAAVTAGDPVRTVEITYDRPNPRPWLALDRKTGESLLRLDDRDQLERLCTRLGWRLARSRNSASKSAA